MAGIPDLKAAARPQWQAWARQNIGGDPVIQAAGVESALSALEAGMTSEQAAGAARQAAAQELALRGQGTGVAAVPFMAPGQPTPAAAAHVPGVVRCRVCGATPAVMVSFRQHTGMVILMQFSSLKGPFCRDCGTAAMRKAVNHTFLVGWLGWLSFFIAPITNLVNIGPAQTIRALPAPDPATRVAPAINPGAGILQRPGVYVYAAALFVILVVFLLPALR